MRDKSTRLTREEWVASAFEALASGGITAVAVEPVARALGVTKGSFYWHFRSLDELLEATLARWELVATESVIERIERIEDAQERLRALLHTALDRHDHLAAEGSIALAAEAGDARVKPAYERVTRRRLAYVEQCVRALGLRGTEAEDRAFAILALYNGSARLVTAGFGKLTSQKALTRYVDRVLALLNGAAPP